MWRAASITDRWLGLSRPGWAWAGQLGLVLLGVHRGADRVDDLLATLLAAVGVSGAARAAMWGAVVVELAAAALAGALFLRGVRGVRPAWRDALRARPVVVLTVPLFWLVCATAGAYAVGLAVGEVVGAVAPPVGVVVGAAGAGLALWRLGWPGWEQVLAGVPTTGRRWDGLAAVPLIAVVTTAAAWSMPVWGWLT